MKKILSLILLMLMGNIMLHAQTRPEVKKSIKPPPAQIRLKPVPAEPDAPPPPPPPPAATQVKTDPTETKAPSVYSLTAVRVKIRTGNDNKEFPSKVHVTLMANSTPANWRNYLQFGLTNEMRVNSETEFGLSIDGQPTPMTTFQQQGLKLTISYEPNFFADAWKIEGITLILEFKDQYGNLHPSMGSKMIVFSNAYGFLNSEYRRIVCVTDASLSPLTANIVK